MTSGGELQVFFVSWDPRRRSVDDSSARKRHEKQRLWRTMKECGDRIKKRNTPKSEKTGEVGGIEERTFVETGGAAGGGGERHPTLAHPRGLLTKTRQEKP